MPCTLHIGIYTFVAIKKLIITNSTITKVPAEGEEINTALQSAEIQKCKRKWVLNYLMDLILIITN